MTPSRTEGTGRRLIRRVREDYVRFLHLEVAGAVVLLAATAIALALANSGLSGTYEDFWHLDLGFAVGDFEVTASLRHWVDDALMALFFFVIGLEIKREFIVGELSAARNAVLPILAAVGGMLVPALVFVAFNLGGEGARGWGVPMANDIAFALGVLTLLGRRIPASLKVFLTALAIADDIGAVIVIALFYSSGIAGEWLLLGALLLGLLALFNYLGIHSPTPYFLVGTVVWFAFLQSGVHATIAGVLLALTIPARAKTAPLDFIERAQEKLEEIEVLEVPGAHTLESDDQQLAAREIRLCAIDVEAPLQRLEHALHPITTFFVLPAFALANAGIVLSGDLASLLFTPLSIGIILGLLLGKQVGITLLTWLAVRLRLAVLPDGVTWRHVYGAAWLGGIGFTMSLFVSGLAFESEALMAQAKLAVLTASIIAGIGGYLVLSRARPREIRGDV